LVSGAPIPRLGALYGQVETHFPTEYQGFLTEMAALTSHEDAGVLTEELGFPKGHFFLTQLLRTSSQWPTGATPSIATPCATFYDGAKE